LTLYSANQAGASRVNSFSGLLSGSGGIVVDSYAGQTGTVIFTANNTYTGGTTLKGTNTLQLGNAGSTGWLAGSLAVDNGGILVFGRTDVVTNSIPVTGTPGAVVQNGTGTLVLTNTAPLFSSAIVNTGLLRITDPAAIPGTGASVTVNSGGSLLMDGSYTTVTNWLNSGRIVNTSSGTLALSGNSSETIDLTSVGGGLYSNLWLGASGNYTYSGTLTPISNTFKLGGGGGTLTVSTPLSGAGTTFDTHGTVSLTGNNSGLSGGVTVKGAGTLIATSANAVGSENVVVQSGGILQVAAPLSMSSGIRIDNAGMVKVVQGGSITGVVTNNSVNGVGAMTMGGLLFSGPGTFTHASSVEGAGAMAINGNGTLNLNTPAQTITQAELWVGNNGSAGNLDMSAGTLNATNWLLVARGTQAGTSLSTFTLRGGTLNKSGGGLTIIGDINGSVGNMVISNNATFNSLAGNMLVSTGNGAGSLSVYGGLLNQTANDLIVANGNGIGTMNLYGGVVTNSAGSVAIGNGAAGRGTLTVTNGLLYARNSVYVGNAAGAVAALNVTNGTLTVGNIIVGNVAGATGTVTQINGTIARAPTGGGEWLIGYAANSVGTYTLQGGALDTGAANFQVGTTGRGTLNQSGGTITSGQWPVVGRAVGGTGFYTLSGGTFNQTGAGNKLIVGEQGVGTFTVNGTGFAELVGGLQLSGGAGNQGTGTVNLATGGTINTPIVLKSSGFSATFNFDGGTLRARNTGASIANFMQGLDAAKVLSGGAVIDSSNNTIIVAQNLSTGATPDGGLTKKGTGTLILTGANTWNGATTVQAGTLSFAGANSLPANSLFVVNGGTLDLYGRTYTTNAFSMTGALVNGTFNASSLTISGNSEVRVKLPSTTLLTKNDAGTSVLASDSAYTGDITINQGTLKIETLAGLLANSLAWFDADDSATRTIDGGGKVATWINKGKTGSLGDAVQVTAGIGPVLKPNALNGRTVFAVQNTKSLVTTNNTGITGALNRTLFTVGCRQNGSMFLAHMGNGTGNNAFGISSETGNSFWYTWGADITMGIQPIGIYEMMDFTLDNNYGTATLYSNNVMSTQTRSFTANTINTPLGLGARMGGTSIGELAEVILYNRALSASERTTVQDYLKAKWFGVGSLALMATSTVDVVTIAANAVLNLDGGKASMTSLIGSGLVTNGQAIVTGDVAPGGIGSLNTLTIPGSPALTGTLRIDVATDGTSDLLKVQGPLNLTDLVLQVDNTSSFRGSKIYKIATFTPGQLTGKFESDNLAGTGMGVVYDNVAGEIRIISIGTMIRFM
jgi:autotransporter-associated beta strand protein